MKKIFKLTFNEIKHLKWTVLVTTLALTLFTASLFSVIFVYNDLSYNVFNHFDATDNTLTFFAYDAAVSRIDDGSLNGIYVGFVPEVTGSGLVITADNGNSFETEYETVEDLGNGVHVTHSYALSGEAVIVTEQYLERYAEIMRQIPMPTKTGEILLDVRISQALQVDAGDSVYIAGKQFTVCGTYSRDDYSYEDFDLNSYWLLAVDENTVFDRVRVEREKSAQVYQMYLRAQRAGIEVSYGGWFTETYLSNMALVEGFLIAVAVTVFAVNLALLYATFSVILHNRTAYVCRLKIMGARDGMVFATYFIIVVALLAVICVAGFFLSQAIVSNIMDVCEQAFGSEFTTNVSFGIVGIYFVIITVLLGALCYLNVRKIDNKACVAVTRSD